MITSMKTSVQATPTWQPRVLLPYMVNSVAISDNAKRIVGCYYYFPYPGTVISDTNGTFCAYCADADGNRLWSDQYEGCQGVFGVAISGDGKVAAAGGLFTDKPQFQGLLRA